MRTIMVLNAKGGSGKSTIATNLASYYASSGYAVALVDYDPQHSSLDWLEARVSGRPPIRGIDGSAANTRIPRAIDYAVIDTPAALHGKDLNAMVRKAESILVPVLPSPFDMRAATRFIQQLFKHSKVVRKEARIALLANRCRTNTNIYHELSEYLKKVRKAPFISVLRESQNYNRASEQGLGIFELPAFAVNRDLDQWQPILEWLDSRRSQAIKRRS